MSRILCVTSGLMGITNASLELVRRVQDDGHEVEYACPRLRGELIGSHGIKFRQLDSIEEDPSPLLDSQGRVRRLVAKWMNHKARKEMAMSTLRPSRFIELIESERYDLLIIDMELHEYVIAAVERKLKVLLLSQWFSIWRAPSSPYILRDFIPGSGIMGRSWWIALDWTYIKWKRKWVFFKRRIISGGTNRSSMLIKYALSSGFPKRYVGENYWPGPFLFEEVPVISMTDEHLEFSMSRRQALTYVGPMVKEDRKEDVEEELRQFVLSGREAGKKLIYCSFSTLSSGDVMFIHKIIRCGNEHPEWNFVISLGGRVEKDIFEAESENVKIFSRVPQLFVLRHADCSLNHGGIHTINECLYYEVPMLVYSGKKSDQNGCAARVAYHGLGIMADKDMDGAGEIGMKIARILNDDSFKEECGLCRDRIIDLKKNKTVEKFINEYMTR